MIMKIIWKKTTVDFSNALFFFSDKPRFSGSDTVSIVLKKPLLKLLHLFENSLCRRERRGCLYHFPLPSNRLMNELNSWGMYKYIG